MALFEKNDYMNRLKQFNENIRAAVYRKDSAICQFFKNDRAAFRICHALRVTSKAILKTLSAKISVCPIRMTGMLAGSVSPSIPYNG